MANMKDASLGQAAGPALQLIDGERASGMLQAPVPLPRNETRCDPEVDGYRFEFDYFDRFVLANVARVTMGLSPHAIYAAWFDWALHLACSPGRQIDLANAATRFLALFGQHLASGILEPSTPAPRPFKPCEGDKRFSSEAWQRQPYSAIVQWFLACEEWWALATAPMRGVDPKRTDRVAFMMRQLLDIGSPTNNPFLNPQIQEHTIAHGGLNLWRGALHAFDDWQRAISGRPGHAAQLFKVGRDVAITPGTVVYRSHLFELIQYRASTPQVYREPVLIPPAWIMKYYILDLRPENSLVRYLVERGHTVFMMSWRNPGPEDRDQSLDDYRRAIVSAIDVACERSSSPRVHLAGYCLGGTIASIAAATMARDGDERLASLTLLAAQTDFSQAGELMLFVDESEIAMIEDLMWFQGVLQGRQMSGAFHLLRSNELIWSRLTRDYVLGERGRVFDIEAWSEDTTRMPYRMHSDYLRGLFLENRLTAGRFAVDGRVIALSDIDAPMFVVATETDHIAPWRSVYKAHLFTDCELSFVLTNGGHNSGILSEPQHRSRHFRWGVRQHQDRYRDPDTWAAQAEVRQGSWWIAWADWLERKSSRERVAAPDPDAATERFRPLAAAPGAYVMMR